MSLSNKRFLTKQNKSKVVFHHNLLLEYYKDQYCNHMNEVTPLCSGYALQNVVLLKI